MNRITSTNSLLTLSAIAAALTVGSSEVHGQATYVGTTGTSSGTRTLWSTTGNWTGTAPTNNATLDLVFSPSAYNYSNNDITGLTANSITFTSTPQSNDNDITGNAITLAGNVTDNTGNYQKVRIDMALGSTTRDFAVNSGQLELYGVLSGSAGLTKSGGATLVLDNNNTYTGGTTVNNGTLQLNKGGNAGKIGGTVTVNSGATIRTANDSFGYNNGSFRVTTLNIVGGTVTHTEGNNLTLASMNINMTGGTLQNTDSNGQLVIYNNGTGNTAINTLASGNTATIAGRVNLSNGGGATTVFTVADGAAADDLLVSANVFDGNSGSKIQKSGAGRMVLSGTNSYTGATTVTDGTLRAGSTQAFGSNSAVLMANTAGAVLDLNNNANSIGSLSGGGTTGGNVTLGSATLTVGGDNTSPGAFAGVISGAGALTKTGNGKLILSNNNTFAGGTTINSGTLELNTGGSAGAIRGTVTVNTGAILSSITGDSLGYNTNTKVNTLNIMGGTVTHNSGGNLTISSATVNMTAGTLQSTGSGVIDIYNNGSGQTTINTLTSANTATIAGKLNLRAGDNDSTGTIFTVADGAAAVDLNVTAVVANGQYQGTNSALQKSGAGLMRLTGANTYSGSTTVNSGTLELANSSGSAAGSTSSIKVLSTGTLLLSNNNQISDSATVSLGGGTIKFGAAVTEGSTSAVGVGALTLTATSTIDFSSFASTLTFSSFAPGSSTLNVTNWTPSSSHLIFNADQSSNLSSFTVNSLAASQIDLGGGFYEITAVPEPGTIVGGIALLGCVGLIERKRIGRVLGSSSSRRIC